MRMPTVFGLTPLGRIEPNRVGAWVDSGVKPCFRVTTRTGRAVEVTGHHPFLTVNGWQPLHDIVVGERIAIPRSVPSFGQDTTMSIGLVRLMAYFIAEGGLTGTTPGFTNTDIEILTDFHALIAEHFPTLRVRRHDITYFPSATRGSPNTLTRWLRDLGLMGKRSEHRIPACVWRLDRERWSVCAGADELRRIYLPRWARVAHRVRRGVRIWPKTSTTHRRADVAPRSEEEGSLAG
jgi:replicative DNA helicase